MWEPVISSTIIDSLWKGYAQDSRASIAYFYLDFTKVQKPNIEGCLHSLLRQLSAKELPAVVKAIHKYLKNVVHSWTRCINGHTFWPQSICLEAAVVDEGIKAFVKQSLRRV